MEDNNVLDVRPNPKPPEERNMDPEKAVPEEEIFAAGAPDAPEDDANEDEDDEDLEAASVEAEQDRQ